MENIISYDYYRLTKTESGNTLNTNASVSTFDFNLNKTNVHLSEFILEATLTRADATPLQPGDVGCVDNNFVKALFDIELKYKSKTLYSSIHLPQATLESIIYKEREDENSLFVLNRQNDGKGDALTTRRGYLMPNGKIKYREKLTDVFPILKSYPETGINITFKITLKKKNNNFAIVRDAQALALNIDEAEFRLFRFEPNNVLEKQILAIDTISIISTQFQTIDGVYENGTNDMTTSHKHTWQKPLNALFICFRQGKENDNQTFSNETLNTDNIRFIQIDLDGNKQPIDDYNEINPNNNYMIYYKSFMDIRKLISGIDSNDIDFSRELWRTVYSYFGFDMRLSNFKEGDVKTRFKFDGIRAGQNQVFFIGVYDLYQTFTREGTDFKLEIQD